MIHETITCALNLMREDLRKVIKDAKSLYKERDKSYFLNEGDYAIFDYFKKLYYQFLQQKGCILELVSFGFKSSQKLEDSEITPANLYTLLCLNGVYLKEINKQVQTFDTPLCKFIWRNQDNYKINFNYDIFLNIPSLFNSLSDCGFIWDNSWSDRYVIRRDYMPGKWEYPLDPNCSEVVNFMVSADDPIMKMSGCFGEFYEDFQRHHRSQCKRCQEYGAENVDISY